ncbi:cytochrome c [Paracoccus laeviglucosivorans]|uniref:Cytochrome c, mono-and diheme variants n=1 Tax=Paracoccus laeviglucosivorans TaxID=1197861 RepID=A0A521FUX4_9RHOB|nr:cytochrome c [Paracoccus laeviglucosivorans]SMO99999.1 Cytochrome c, mono-and diheme variants [Paracoccus laeviglucosivorans]
MSMKQILTGVAGLAVIAAVGAGALLWQKHSTTRNGVADDSVALADFQSTDAEAIKRGEYVMRSADCAACHTRESGDFAGGYEIATPFGTLISSNISPDRETGIGAMTQRDFFDAVRNGQGSKGLLYPAMPYTAYAKISDQDMQDLWAYMSTVKPVSHAIDENAGMGFPYNQRLAMAGWNMLFFDNSGFEAHASADPVVERGRYLVEGAGHCSACHTPRNGLGAEIGAQYLQGARIGSWFAPEITGNAHVGLGESSIEEVATYLRSGTDGKAMASGPMAEAVEHSLQYMTQDDARAMATYLKSLPGSELTAPQPIPATDPAMTRGALAYEVNCSACHGVAGEGMGLLAPAFAGNHAVLSDNVTNLAHVMLKGARAASSHDAPTGGGMPSFDWKMNDRQIADVLDYIRNSWGNSAHPVNEGDITALRTSLDAREKLPTLAP